MTRRAGASTAGSHDPGTFRSASRPAPARACRGACPSPRCGSQPPGLLGGWHSLRAGIGAAGLEAGDRINAVTVDFLGRARPLESIRSLLATTRRPDEDSSEVGKRSGCVAGVTHAMVLPIVQRGSHRSSGVSTAGPLSVTLAWASVAAHAGTAWKQPPGGGALRQARN
jgi:hypothetical protein